MVSPLSNDSVGLNADIFNHFLDIVIGWLKGHNINYRRLSPNDLEIILLARSLRLVSQLANTRLRPFLSPTLEIASTQQAARAMFTGGIPNLASMRCLTIKGGVKGMYLPHLLALPYRKLVLDNRSSSPARSSLETDIERLDSDIGVRDLVLLLSRGSKSCVLEDQLFYHIESQTYDVERLALYGRRPGRHASCRTIRVLVVRWEQGFCWILRTLHLIIRIYPRLERIVLVYSRREAEIISDGLPLTTHQKLETAQLKPRVSISVVHPNVEEGGIEGWFVEHVRNDTIWDLEGENWLDTC